MKLIEDLIPAPYGIFARLLMYMALAAALAGFGYTRGLEHADAVANKHTEQQNAAAQKQLMSAINDKDKKEKAFSDLKDQVEVSDREKQKHIAELSASNRALATQLGGLRDPGARARCNDAAGAVALASSVGVGDATEGRLSAEASQFLLDFAAEADDAARYANTCHDWAIQLNAVVGSPPASIND